MNASLDAILNALTLAAENSDNPEKKTEEELTAEADAAGVSFLEGKLMELFGDSAMTQRLAAGTGNFNTDAILETFGFKQGDTNGK